MVFSRTSDTASLGVVWAVVKILGDAAAVSDGTATASPVCFIAVCVAFLASAAGLVPNGVTVTVLRAVVRACRTLFLNVPVETMVGAGVSAKKVAAPILSSGRWLGMVVELAGLTVDPGNETDPFPTDGTSLLLTRGAASYNPMHTIKMKYKLGFTNIIRNVHFMVFLTLHAVAGKYHLLRKLIVPADLQLLPLSS